MNELVTTETPLVFDPGYDSPALMRLPEDRRPVRSTVCEHCPAAVWLAAPDVVKCYCRIMKLITWSTTEPAVLTVCDGQIMAIAALEKE